MDLIALATGRKSNHHYANLDRKSSKEKVYPSFSLNENNRKITEKLSTDNKSDFSHDSKVDTRIQVPYLVTWGGLNDPLNPRNWSYTRKWWVVIQVSTITIVVTFASSVYSTGTVEISEDLDLLF